MARYRKKSFSNTMKQGEVTVARRGNVISIYRMDRPSCASNFLRKLQAGIDEGYKSFSIRWLGELVYPEACVPIAGIIAFYKENYQIKFSYDLPKESYLKHCHFSQPIVQDAQQLKEELFPFDKLYRYSSSTQVASLSKAYIDGLSKLVECGEGVLNGLTWCISEVMDNVLLHSDAGHGFVMAQYHQEKKTLAICVYDSGIGIYNSLSKSKHKPKTASDAISLAVQEGIGDGKGQGNGLFGLYQVIAENKGSLKISSGPSSIMWKSNKEMEKSDHLRFISREFGATSVVFILKLQNTIDIQSAFSSIGGYDGFDIRIDNMITDDGVYLYDVFENSTGTATRESGELLRNDVINIIRRTKEKLVLDFQGVQTVSSSFVDEFIAKLVIRLGFLKFNHFVKLINMNDDISFLIERSLYMRIHDDWENRNSTVEQKVAKHSRPQKGDR